MTGASAGVLGKNLVIACSADSSPLGKIVTIVICKCIRLPVVRNISNPVRIYASIAQMVSVSVFQTEDHRFDSDCWLQQNKPAVMFKEPMPASVPPFVAASCKEIFRAFFM